MSNMYLATLGCIDFLFGILMSSYVLMALGDIFLAVALVYYVRGEEW
jgi:hypothetical protein